MRQYIWMLRCHRIAGRARAGIPTCDPSRRIGKIVCTNSELTLKGLFQIVRGQVVEKQAVMAYAVGRQDHNVCFPPLRLKGMQHILARQ